MGFSCSSIGAALFGSAKQAVLRVLFNNPDRRFYQRQVIAMARCGSGAVQRELQQLAQAGILTRTVEGRQTYFQANSLCPVFEELRGLVRKTFGVAEALRQKLKPIAAKVDLAFIYGSLAEGRETAASDIDVMLIGKAVSMSDAVAAFSAVERDLGREINPSVYRTEEFRRKLAEGHHFLTSVVAGSKIFLVGDENELGGLAEVRVAQGAQDKPQRNRRSSRRG
jgi:predicted nucleotidyltransferase